MGNEPLNSPFSRVYLCPKTEQVINCAMGLKNPIDVEALKKAFSNSIILKHPRFCSLLVKDQNNNGVERWERIQVNIDDHIVVHHPTTTTKTRLGDEDVEAEINAYLADISVSTPLSENKPLWEVHLLMGMNCVVLRVHHALGDGASLMSLLTSCFGGKSGNNHHNINVSYNNYNDDNSTGNSNSNSNKKAKNNMSEDSKKRSWREKSVWGFIKTWWLTIVFGLKLLGRILWVKDKQSVISGGDGVELWPRILVTSKFNLQDFKCIKKAIPSATINDVLLGVISSGLSKYLEIKSPKAMLQGLQVTGIVVVNLRKNAGLQEMSSMMGASTSPPSWGNKTGLILQPIYCYNGLHPFEHVKIMKAIMDQKKISYEAHIPYIALNWLSFYFGPKVASWVSHRVLCHTSLLISNIMGPSEEMVIGDNPVTYLRVNISGQPHAITMHLVSYKGNADLQIMVAKDIIHDPQFLAKCIQDSLSEMKNCISQDDKMSLF